MYLLDSDIVIDILKGNSDYLKEYELDDSAITAISYGEVLFGIEDEKDKEMLDNEFLSFNYDKTCAEIFSIVKHLLHSKGRIIPMTDMQIASTAIKHNLVLMTRDNHFKDISGLKVVFPGNSP